MNSVTEPLTRTSTSMGTQMPTQAPARVENKAFAGGLLWLLCASTAALGGCDPAGEPASEGGSDRAPIGKADLAGSCVAACGGKSGGNCWCDDLCEAIGDCCSDHASACLGEATACEMAGGSCVFPSPEGCGPAATAVDAACELANDLCCVPDGGDESSTGEPPPSCEAQGGDCVFPSPDGCGAGTSIEGTCELANDFCCLPDDAETTGEPLSCEAQGGDCVFPSPAGCGAATSIEGTCELANDFCCL